MASKRPAKNKDSQLIKLTRELMDELAGLKNAVNTLSARILGDKNMQTQGLIDEVHDVEKKAHSATNRVAECERRIGVQEDALKGFSVATTEKLKAWDPYMDAAKEGKGIVKRLWSLIALVVTGCGGAILAHFLHW